MKKRSNLMESWFGKDRLYGVGDDVVNGVSEAAQAVGNDSLFQKGVNLIGDMGSVGVDAFKATLNGAEKLGGLLPFNKIYESLHNMGLVDTDIAITDEEIGLQQDEALATRTEAAANAIEKRVADKAKRIEKLKPNKVAMVKYGFILILFGACFGCLRYSSIKEQMASIKDAKGALQIGLKILSIVAQLSVAFVPIFVGCMILWFCLNDKWNPDSDTFCGKILDASIYLAATMERVFATVFENKTQNYVARLSKIQLQLSQLMKDVANS